jgi:serine/threonine protein kinase
MEKFKELKKIGDGSFGAVIKAVDNNNQLVAIKKMKQKYKSWEECMQLRELKALQKLKHANIIKLKEVLRLNDELSFVFEYAERNILQHYQAYKD